MADDDVVIVSAIDNMTPLDRNTSACYCESLLLRAKLRLTVMAVRSNIATHVGGFAINLPSVFCFSKNVHVRILFHIRILVLYMPARIQRLSLHWNRFFVHVDRNVSYYFSYRQLVKTKVFHFQALRFVFFFEIIPRGCG